jgi:hypothetical protein
MRDEVADTPQGVIKLKASKRSVVPLSSLIAAALIPYPSSLLFRAVRLCSKRG